METQEYLEQAVAAYHEWQAEAARKQAELDEKNRAHNLETWQTLISNIKQHIPVELHEMMSPLGAEDGDAPWNECVTVELALPDHPAWLVLSFHVDHKREVELNHVLIPNIRVYRDDDDYEVVELDPAHGFTTRKLTPEAIGAAWRNWLDYQERCVEAKLTNADIAADRAAAPVAPSIQPDLLTRASECIDHGRYEEAGARALLSIAQSLEYLAENGIVTTPISELI